MPGVNQPWWRYQQQILAGGIRQGVANGTQQQNVITNLSGEPVINFGLIPGSNPPEFGMQLVNKQFGAPLAFFGEDNAGNVSEKFYASDGQTVLFQIDDTGFGAYNSGSLITKQDATGFHLYNSSGVEIGRFGLQDDGTYGLRIFDTSGNEQAMLGEIASSPALYGLAVNQGGVMQRVAGALSQTGIGTISPNTNGAWVAVGPTVTATIGPSGSALVTTLCYIGTLGANQEGSASMSVDGSLVSSFPHAIVSCSATGGASATVTATEVITGMSAGSHNFQQMVQCGGNYTVNFSNATVVVVPL